MAKLGRNFFHKFRDKSDKKKYWIIWLRCRGIKRYFEEKEKLSELLLHEETYWKQCAQIFWHAEGDLNFKYFHVTTFFRRKSNNIAFLRKYDGEIVDGHEEMSDIIKNHYMSIFANLIEDQNPILINGLLMHIMRASLRDCLLLSLKLLINKCTRVKRLDRTNLILLFLNIFWAC